MNNFVLVFATSGEEKTVSHANISRERNQLCINLFVSAFLSQFKMYRGGFFCKFSIWVGVENGINK